MPAHINPTYRFTTRDIVKLARAVPLGPISPFPLAHGEIMSPHLEEGGEWVLLSADGNGYDVGV